MERNQREWAEVTANEADADRAIWVFGYGSLMWRPGFRHLEAAGASLPGYRRSFCIWSEHHRGTRDRRGLVLGLAPVAGGACAGRAFRVDRADWRDIAAYLEERELRGYAYRPAYLPVDLDGGRRVAAHCFVADPEHPHFAGDLDPDRAARIILEARGRSGLNRDYLINTVEALEANGYREPTLKDLLVRVRALTGAIEAGGGI
ncbi:gamma-glutamylcyclotransferase [Marivibrio halodurans]|uniref:glutathione-specific gamma-glutamylcyclotransferase n=1 Tax=Marivibrio halodurans TaxID=2039722 RepID=A0A8J7SI64_9PROT|nr:gamma-glutamylcyclotransferase [Marivibrio halodurans]MBP5856883.1 gamma-glutamylcyclotransferase [Marivibrio halodurans]